MFGFNPSISGGTTQVNGKRMEDKETTMVVRRLEREEILEEKEKEVEELGIRLAMEISSNVSRRCDNDIHSGHDKSDLLHVIVSC